MGLDDYFPFSKREELGHLRIYWKECEEDNMHSLVIIDRNGVEVRSVPVAYNQIKKDTRALIRELEARRYKFEVEVPESMYREKSEID